MKTLLVLFALASSAFPLHAADSQTEATHNELRALRDGLMAAMNKGDIEGQLAYLHTNVVVTWHNAEVSRGREGVLAYYKRLTSGPEKLVASFTAEIVVDELTILHGENTGISFGSSVEHFKLTNGSSFDLKGRWSATLVKEDGKWLIASLHASTNLFDNVILEIIKKKAFQVTVIALVVGAMAGGLAGWLLGRKRRVASA